MNTFYVERLIEDSHGLTWTFINDESTADRAAIVLEMLRDKYPERTYRLVEVLDV